MPPEKQLVVIHTDGACRGNPGPGGWGVVLNYRGRQKTRKGAVPETTNNRMELTAAVEGLTSLKRSCRVVLYTDSEYLRRGILEWMDNWKKKNWRTAAGKPVRNRDLWELLDQASSNHEVDWRWVKGHSGDPGNELADQLANEAIDDMLSISDEMHTREVSS